MTNKVIQGTYADFKLIKSRNVAQFIIEVPIEQAKAAISMFGVPTPQEEQWVAVAALETRSVQSQEEKYSAVKSAAMLCQSIDFAKFLKAKYDPSLANHPSGEEVASSLRAILGITSRSELHENEKALMAFERLKGEYHSWMMN
jgi:hypothetical protein